jgi:hypothetical protein
VVAPAEAGTTDFSVLPNELKGKSTKISRFFRVWETVGRSAKLPYPPLR